MATFRAIRAATAAVTHLLDDALPGSGFRDELDFKVIDGLDVTAGLSSGGGVLPYRVDVSNGARHASPTGGPVGNGVGAPVLPVDVRLVVAVSHPDSGRKLSLTGWVMRTLADHPVLPATLLNRGTNRPVFADDETVQLRNDVLSDEMLLALWGLLGVAQTHAVLLPYVLSGIAIESEAS